MDSDGRKLKATNFLSHSTGLRLTGARPASRHKTLDQTASPAVENRKTTALNELSNSRQALRRRPFAASWSHLPECPHLFATSGANSALLLGELFAEADGCAGRFFTLCAKHTGERPHTPAAIKEVKIARFHYTSPTMSELRNVAAQHIRTRDVKVPNFTIKRLYVNKLVIKLQICGCSIIAGRVKLRKLLSAILFSLLLAGASTPSQAGDATFKLTNNAPFSVMVKFFSQTRHWEWPSTTSHWSLGDNGQHSFRLGCQDGEKICYGGSYSADDKTHWGVGFKGDKPCHDCCLTCGSNVSHSWN